MLSNINEALRPLRPTDFQQAQPEPASEAANAGESEDVAAQQQPTAEDTAQESCADGKEASKSAEKNAAHAASAQGIGDKPHLEVKSAPSAAEKLELEIAATAEQVSLFCRARSWAKIQLSVHVQPRPSLGRAASCLLCISILHGSSAWP